MLQHPNEQIKYDVSKELAGDARDWDPTSSIAAANDAAVTVPNTMTDQELARAVRDALEWNVRVPDERIRTTVSDGSVTLEGEVDTLCQRSDADWVIVNLEGVKGVANEITIVKPETGPVKDGANRPDGPEAGPIRIDVEGLEDDFYERVRARLSQRQCISRPPR